MNTKCGLIRDLLPMYVENIASESSKALVREHLCNCKSCAEEYKEMKKTVCIPIDADVAPLLNLSEHARRMVLMAVLTVLFLLSAIFHAFYICYNVPVWYTAEEAIEKIELMDDGTLFIYPTMHAGGVFSFENGYYSQGIRLLTEERQKRIEAGYSPIRKQLPNGMTSFWYVGDLAGEESALLWGNEGDQPPAVGCDHVDYTLQYIFWCTLAGGVVLLFVAFCTRKKKCVFVKKGALLLLLCAASNWFVTGGRFLQLRRVDVTLQSDLIFILTEYSNLFHIIVFTFLLCGFAFSAQSFVAVYMESRRLVADL